MSIEKVIVLEDDAIVRANLENFLRRQKFDVVTAPTLAIARDALSRDNFDLIFMDMRLPDGDSIELLKELQTRPPRPLAVVMTGFGSVESAVECMKNGSFDYLIKPFSTEQIEVTLRKAQEFSQLVKVNHFLSQESDDDERELIGRSPAMENLRQLIRKVARTQATVLIHGESGTGKELVARWVHEKSNRSQSPLIEVNCAAIPGELIESELFGHEKGAFTSAIKQKLGKFELANGGTLFLDEIGDMSLSAQAKVLRALQENRITRVGGDKDILVDVRVIAATNKDLTREIEEGRFRMDLYHRLSVILIHVPSLHERADDIPQLADRFVREVCEDYGIPKKVITPKALEELKTMRWDGNIRELRNVMERLVILSDQKITEDEVKSFVTNTQAKETPTDLFEQFDKFQDFKEHIEKLFIEHKLRKFNWNVSKTAEVLDIQRSHLYNKIEKFDLRRN